MPTSDAPTKGGWKRHLLHAVIVLVVLVVLDLALIFVLEPYGSYSETAWYEYRTNTAAGEKYDTIVVGSSVTADGLQPAAIDEILNTKSFCLASPGQSQWASLKALETALEDHPVKRVIFGTSFSTLSETAWSNSDMACIQAQANGLPFPKNVAKYWELLSNPEFIGETDSLSFLAPFTLNHVKYTPSAIIDNVRKRLECANALEASERASDKLRHYGQGYANYDLSFDMSTYSEIEALSRSIETRKELDVWEGMPWERWEPTRKMIALCEERGIEFVLVIMPHPYSETIPIGDDYPLGMGTVRDYVEDHGGTYLDFSLAKRELYYPADMANYMDLSHLSASGAALFTPVMARTIARAEAGEDVSGDFYAYEDWDEYLASVDVIGFVYFDGRSTDEGVQLYGVAFPGTTLDVEYEYAVRTGEDGEYEVVRPYDRDPNFLLTGYDYGELDMRLSARVVGTEEPESVHYQKLTCPIPTPWQRLY